MRLVKSIIGLVVALTLVAVIAVGGLLGALTARALPQVSGTAPCSGFGRPGHGRPRRRRDRAHHGRHDP